MLTYRWRIPGEILEAEAIRAEGTTSGTFVLDPTGAGLTYRDGTGASFAVESPRAGVSLIADPARGARSVYRRAGDTIYFEGHAFEKDQWAVKTQAERTRIRPDAAAIAIADLKGRQELALAAAAEAERKSRAGFIGLNWQALTSKESRKLKLAEGVGGKVLFTLPEQPARQAGLLPDDVVVAVDGVESSLEAIIAALRELPEGQTAMLTVLREGQRLTLPVKPTSWPPEEELYRLALLDPSLPREVRARRLRAGDTITSETTADDRGSGPLYRAACFRIMAEPGENLRITLAPQGERAGLMLGRGCGDAFTEAHDNEGHRGDLSMIVTQDRSPYFAQVYLRGKGKKYQLVTASLTAQQVAEIRQRERQAQLAEAQRDASGGGGGLLGALGGAALGAIAGGNTEQIVGAAMKGAAMVDPNAAALDAVGDSLIGGNTGSLASAGSLGGLGGAGAGGSFPTRPNALDGSAACSMMNQGNYRDVSLSGGNDVQLKTMCGQAFEYYSMYLRAIEQGYSEADANRTYDAHQQAALNAISFYENNR